jgi:hypothetical protein
MAAIVIRTRYDEGTESAEVATSALNTFQVGKGGQFLTNKKYMESVSVISYLQNTN